MSRASTGHIRKLKNGRFQARFTFPDGVRRPAPTTFQTKRDATAWLAQQSADVSRGQWSLTKATMPVSFADYADEWLKHRKVRGRSLADRTLSNYQDLLDRFILPTFGHQLIHTVTRESVDNWYDSVAPKHTPTYRARAYALLRAIFTSAVDEGQIMINPVKIRGAGYVQRRHQVRTATIEELEAITEAMPPAISSWSSSRRGASSGLGS
jgi:Phage integrase, N-terminal SAM-like domain